LLSRLNKYLISQIKKLHNKGKKNMPAKYTKLIYYRIKILRCTYITQM